MSNNFVRPLQDAELPCPAGHPARGEEREKVRAVVNGKIKEWKFANISYI
jgi:hypothetical protein